MLELLHPTAEGPYPWLGLTESMVLTHVIASWWGFTVTAETRSGSMGIRKQVRLPKPLVQPYLSRSVEMDKLGPVVLYDVSPL